MAMFPLIKRPVPRRFLLGQSRLAVTQLAKSISQLLAICHEPKLYRRLTPGRLGMPYFLYLPTTQSRASAMDNQPG